jgi:hypothetical protein
VVTNLVRTATRQSHNTDSVRSLNPSPGKIPVSQGVSGKRNVDGIIDARQPKSLAGDPSEKDAPTFPFLVEYPRFPLEALNKRRPIGEYCNAAYTALDNWISPDKSGQVSRMLLPTVQF